MDFANIKTLTYQAEPYRGSSHRPHSNYASSYEGAGDSSGSAIFLSLMIQVAMPCAARKRVPGSDGKKDWTSQSRSPFNMGSGELFLNNWNLNQTFIFKGRTTESQLDRFLAVVRQRSLSANILNQKIEQIRPGKDTCLQHLKELKNRSCRFLSLLDQLKVQLRYSVMALLSENKITLFNDSIVTLVQLLIAKGWSLTQDTADYGSFLLDKMHLQLDPKKVPYHDLVELFKEQKNKENDDEFEDSRTNLNYLRQHRVNITPTLIKFTPGEEEESNRVIRNFKEQLPNFLRLCFLTDTQEKGYYCGGNGDSLLGYVHSVMSHGFALGSCRFQFLGYSNSQLKNHSCWFLCKDNPSLPITEEQIVNYMGNFDKETNILKKFARKGQCFSTSRFVCALEPEQVTFGVEDIKRNGYCFTDGVGYISTELA